jgi:hypothetical protein
MDLFRTDLAYAEMLDAISSLKTAAEKLRSQMAEADLVGDNRIANLSEDTASAIIAHAVAPAERYADLIRRSFHLDKVM